MSLRSSSPPPHTTADPLPPVTPTVHVAVGRSIPKTLALLKRTFHHFKCKEIGLIHIHQPSPMIPTLMGKLPVDYANEDFVAEYRRKERKEAEMVLKKYQSFCYRAQVHPKIIINEAGNVQKGIVDLIRRHGICKLVIGATSDSCMMVKGRSKKVIYVAKNTPHSCEIWFISKGKHLWTTEASEVSYAHIPFPSPDESTSRERIQPSSAERIISSELYSEVHELKGVNNRLKELRKDIERSKEEALEEFTVRKKLESDTAEAFNKIKISESATVDETKIREELQELLLTTKKEREESVCKKNETMRELESSRSSLAHLDMHAKEMVNRHAEIARELEHIQSSIRILQLEKRKRTQQQNEKPFLQSERWRNRSSIRSANRVKIFGFDNHLEDLTVFSASDIENATCEFSECFKLWQGGYGCVYKGEMLNKTVVIKKLHLHNSQGEREFEQEVNVLGKLKHPHLVSLIGICPELLSLVFEYLPNGPLHLRLFHKTIPAPLNWKTRTRIAAQISSALLFLHSLPERIIHGDLKPDNIFLDSEFNCKLSDFGICHFVPMGELPYTDPESKNTGVLAPKSDVYSLGVIILQLLTGKFPVGLASQVRQAVLAGNLSLMLDTTAGWPNDVAERLAVFGLECCEVNSGLRPDITPDIVRELEKLYLIEEQPVPPFFLCPILQEIMNDPQVAADGFSYEGKALREWLENGRGTSPMTNLELDHLNLTPNHALRFAIQDWLCQSENFLSFNQSL